MHFLTVIVVSILFVLEIKDVITDDDIIMQKSFYDRDMEPIQEQRSKKPFCNAFTGCGRKRSDESMATAEEIDMDPSINELKRQISSSSKLLETLQEARLGSLSGKPAVFRPMQSPLFNYRPKNCDFHHARGNYPC